ncbi:MAG: leucyl aminopeptidase [Chlamydiales bacterium]
MQIHQLQNFKARKKADLLLLPFWQGKKSAEPAFHHKPLLAQVKLPLAAGDFTGKEGETQFLYLPRFPELRVLLLGMGKADECSMETVRSSFASATRSARRKKCKKLNILFPDTKLDEKSLSSAMAEGIFLANYSFSFKEKDEEKDTKIDTITLIGANKSVLETIKRKEQLTEAVTFTRNLVNGNADEMNAQRFVQEAKEIAKEFSKVGVKVLGQKELEKEKMGLMLAVNRGAMQEPALILIEYKGDPDSKDITAIVGKGISFDTGGLNLKPTNSIETMKCDMAGAGAVLGALRAAASLGLKKNLIGVVAAAENAIGPKSYKPGDVFRSHSGKTVEITNTDAEGRLVLADALSYLQKHYKVSRIIDLATLTGGVVVALGEEVTGFFSNDEKLAKGLAEAGERTYERLWRLPLYREYLEPMKSPIADLRNSGGGRKASPIMGAIFLNEFIEKGMPWAHLDIAGTAFLSELHKPYHPSYATGVGVRLLIEFLENLA